MAKNQQTEDPKIKAQQDLDAAAGVAGASATEDAEKPGADEEDPAKATDGESKGAVKDNAEDAAAGVAGPMKVRMVCTNVHRFASGNKDVTLEVDQQDEVNKHLTDYTPAGSFVLSIQAGKPSIDLFEQGKKFDLDITPVEATTTEA